MLLCSVCTNSLSCVLVCNPKCGPLLGHPPPFAGGESGSADTVRDPRGFAVKFYTEDGNWDLVGNDTPIFFIRDPLLVSRVSVCPCVFVCVFVCVCVCGWVGGCECVCV